MQASGRRCRELDGEAQLRKAAASIRHPSHTRPSAYALCLSLHLVDESPQVQRLIVVAATDAGIHQLRHLQQLQQRGMRACRGVKQTSVYGGSCTGGLGDGSGSSSTSLIIRTVKLAVGCTPGLDVGSLSTETLSH